MAVSSPYALFRAADDHWPQLVPSARPAGRAPLAQVQSSAALV